jgi:hypothetical protein
LTRQRSHSAADETALPACCRAAGPGWIQPPSVLVIAHAQDDQLAEHCGVGLHRDENLDIAGGEQKRQFAALTEAQTDDCRRSQRVPSDSATTSSSRRACLWPGQHPQAARRQSVQQDRQEGQQTRAAQLDSDRELHSALPHYRGT